MGVAVYARDVPAGVAVVDDGGERGRQAGSRVEWRKGEEGEARVRGVRR